MNQRRLCQRIYSPPPLTTRALPLYGAKNDSSRLKSRQGKRESNRFQSKRVSVPDEKPLADSMVTTALPSIPRSICSNVRAFVGACPL